MLRFFQGAGIPQTPGGTAAAPSAAPPPAVLARRREVGPVAVFLARLARQGGYADATGPSALGISDVVLRAALAAALRATEPGFPSYFDDGVLDVFYDSRTVVYVTYPEGTARYWWQTWQLAPDSRSVRLNGDRQEVSMGWVPDGPVATPPAPVPPPAGSATATASATATPPPTPASIATNNAHRYPQLRDLSAWLAAQERTPMPYAPSAPSSYKPPRIFDAALHAQGLPGIGETAPPAGSTTTPSSAALDAFCSVSVRERFSLADLELLAARSPRFLAPLATAGRTRAATCRGYAALGLQAPQRSDCSIYDLYAAQSELDRLKAAGGAGNRPPCGCGSHPAPTATPAASTATGSGYTPPRIFDAALAAKGLPPIGGKK